MLLTVLSLLFACEPKEEGSICSSDIRSSIILTVEDQDGNPVDNADISYTVDGVEGTFIEAWSSGQYVLGEEEAGDFIVDIYAEISTDDPCCQEVGTATLEFTIEENECHVETQEFETELEWELVCVDVDENGECG